MGFGVWCRDPRAVVTDPSVAGCAPVVTDVSDPQWLGAMKQTGNTGEPSGLIELCLQLLWMLHAGTLDEKLCVTIVCDSRNAIAIVLEVFRPRYNVIEHGASSCNSSLELFAHV